MFQNYILLEEFLKSNGYSYLKDNDLKNYNTFKIGGKADYIVSPDTDEKAVALLKFCDSNSFPCCFHGNGSNVLFDDDGYRGVIITTKQLNCIDVNGDNIICGSGTKLSSLCNAALQNSLTGIECLYGIPGTIGGAIITNAGAYGGEICDNIVNIKYINNDYNVAVMPKSEADFCYRHSAFADNGLFILGAEFKLRVGDKKTIENKMCELMCKRKDKQPLEYPSAGSIFKRPIGGYAAELIERCGLKGKAVGGAMVSTKHSGFIINTGNAKCSDVLELIEIIKDKVYKETGILLECEVRRMS
ncbi:MAG: UDP-N-acetylmuramate dehydrogenase [Acutalibacteraceae bacterium]|nr:UDP-N-acetylmuramate dehydrogenase [Acutalibacteraceae bacterium]